MPRPMRSTKSPADIDVERLTPFLEDIYGKYNRKGLIHPDPLEFLYDYSRVEDREIVGLIASSLAYGRVAQILKSVSSVLAAMGSSPFDFVVAGDRSLWMRCFSGFRHRFSGSDDVVDLLCGVRGAIDFYGSLDRTMERALKETNSVFQGYGRFAKWLVGKEKKNSLLPLPGRGSACKRLMLYFRWMVRRDEVDPGGWSSLSPSDLVVPLDTHMHKIARVLGFTSRKNGDFRTAVEVTEAFGLIDPGDPVKYDFALTRFGIRDDMELKALFEEVRPKVGGIVG